MIQQGQVFKLKATGVDGEPLWAYRYRVAGRDSVRRQAGGFTTKAEAQRALQNRLARLLPGGRAETLTLAEWVEEYLGAHQGERVTIAKLRWLLGKATVALGEVRLAELSPDQVSGWRLTVPEGHRFEATQALRQVLNRAVTWKLIDDNPAKRVPNPARRCREQRPFDSWQQIRSLAEHLWPPHGPMVLFAAATGLRPSELFALEHRDVDRAAGVVQIRRAYANGRVKHTKTRLSRRAVPLQGIALEAPDQLQPREDSLLLFPNARGGHLDFFLKKGCVSSSQLVDGTSSDAPGRLDAHLFLGVWGTPCRWELSRLLNSIRGRQAAKAKRELAGTESPLVDRGAGLKGSLRESMCQTAIRILRATAALAELRLPERALTSR